MLSITALAQSIGSESIVIRGEPVKVKALSVAERDRIMALFPEPEPPLMKDPAKGSAAPRQPDRENPAYRAELYAWRTRQMAMVAVVATGISHLPPASPAMVYSRAMSDEEARAFLSSAADALVEALTDAELGQIVAAERRAASWSQTPDSPERLALVAKITPEELAALQQKAAEPGEALTLAAVILDTCERYGYRPDEFDQLAPGLARMLVERNLQRSREEQRARVDVLEGVGRLVQGFLGK